MNMTITKNADDVLRHISVIERLAMNIIEIAAQGWQTKQFPLVMACIREMNASPEQFIGMDRAEIMEQLIMKSFPKEDTALIARSIKQKYGV